MANDANLFTFESDGSKISYSTSSLMGVPLFSYQEGDTSISTPHFISETGALGTVVTMTIEVVPDGWTRDLSLIVPHVHLQDPSAEEDVESIAIFSRHLSNIAGHDAVKGQTTTYTARKMSGKASLVAF